MGRRDPRWAPMIRRVICRTCDGLCCTNKETLVILDREEAERRLHQYRYERRGLGPFLIGSYPILKKRKDGSCVYFDRERKKCGIYRRRPAACKAWFCGKGTRTNAIWLRLKGES